MQSGHEDMCFSSDRFYLARKMIKLFLDILTLSKDKHLFTSCQFHHTDLPTQICVSSDLITSPRPSHSDDTSLTPTLTAGPAGRCAQSDKKAIDTELHPVVRPCMGPGT